MHPRILVVRDHQHQVVNEYVVDLKDSPIDAKGLLLKIKELLPDDGHGIKFKEYCRHKLVVGEN